MDSVSVLPVCDKQRGGSFYLIDKNLTLFFDGWAFVYIDDVCCGRGVIYE